jgi:hypothetical protein
MWEKLDLYLALKKRFCWRNSGAFKTDRGGFYRMGTPGAPHIICVIEGQFVGIEVKDEKGRLNRNQIAFKERLEAAGDRYVLARSIDDVQEMQL